MNEKYVLTGGLAHGKSTMLDELARIGYPCYTSLSQEVLDESNRGVLPRQTPRRFARAWFKKKLEQYNATSEGGFFERSIVDPAAMFLWLEEEIPPDLIDQIKAHRYANPILIVEPVPHDWFKDGWPRKEFNPSESLRYHQRLVEIYTHFGYSLLSIPALPLGERIDFVLHELGLVVSP